MTRTASNRAAYLIAIVMATSSCAERMHEVGAGDLTAGEGSWFAVPGGDEGRPREISGRVRIELPRYRVRGACGLYWSGDGVLQIDFDHSSLFGAYREEATILIGGGRIEVRDELRGTTVRDGEALAMLGEHLGLEIYGDDLVYVLLLRPLRLDAGPVEVERSGGELTVKGSWRGRSVEIEGRAGLPPSRLKVVSPDGVGYETRYGYRKGAPGSYPERIVCERIGGSGKISLTIEQGAEGTR